MERQYSNAIFTNFQQELRGNENNDETKFVKLRYVIKAQHVRVRPTFFYKHKADEWYLPRIRIIDRILNIFPLRIPTLNPISTSLR